MTNNFKGKKLSLYLVCKVDNNGEIKYYVDGIGRWAKYDNFFKYLERNFTNHMIYGIENSAFFVSKGVAQRHIDETYCSNKRSPYDIKIVEFEVNFDVSLQSKICDK